jgi:peptide/nickel transport system substrate-binding protein/oligopeptide transport system substrate-binding protein
MALLALGGLAILDCGRARGPVTGAEQIYRFRLREDPPTLDPHLATDQLSEAVLMGLFRGLVELDPATLEVRPSVAESWTISEDRRTYTFRLRDDVLFHNGRRVTAQDVEYSLLRVLRDETQAPRRFLLETIEGAEGFTAGELSGVPGITTPDDHTIAIRLTKPHGPFLSQLTMLVAAIVPREIYEDPDRAYLRSPVGCGPFRFERWRWEQSNFIELEAFDDFFGGRPPLDRIIVRIIENYQSALQEYRAGGLDSLDQVPRDRDAGWIAELEKEIHRYAFLGTGYIGFNLAVPPFRDNVALRKAFNYAVDKRYLWEVLMASDSRPANGLIPPGAPGHDPDLPGYPYDPAAAARHLAEAGYPEGQGLPPISLWVNTSEDNRRLAQQIQSDLRKLGVEIQIREVDWGTYIAAIEGTAEEPGEAQMFRFGWYLDYPDPDAILRPLLHSSNIGPGGNYFRYSNPEFDRLIEEALDLTDAGERADRYREAQRIAVMEDAAILLLNYIVESTLFKPHVKGIVLTPLGEFRIPLERLRIERTPS